MHQSGWARSATRLACTCSGIAPRFTTNSSDSTSSQTKKRISRPPCSLQSVSRRTQAGAQAGASFWKKDLPVIPSGWRTRVSGRSLR
jgi:hypothetical protein